jgi:hypothetical protein
MKVEMCRLEDLTKEEQEWQPENGPGKEYSHYLVITWDNGERQVESDGMCPEDSIFPRDLSWIKDTIERAYKEGQKAKES